MIKIKQQPKFVITIRPGPVSPVARASLKKWWAARIAECQVELKSESEGKDG